MALMERVRKTKNEYLIEQDPGVDESCTKTDKNS